MRSRSTMLCHYGAGRRTAAVRGLCSTAMLDLRRTAHFQLYGPWAGRQAV